MMNNFSFFNATLKGISKINKRCYILLFIGILLCPLTTVSAKNVDNYRYNCYDKNGDDTQKTVTKVVACNPEITAFAIQPSCDNGVVQSDGYLQLSAVTSGDRYHFSPGSSFDDNSGTNTYANATDLTGATYPLQFNTGLGNSDVGDYTIRVYNGGDVCFTDVVVTLNTQDCTHGCDCEEMVYLNEVNGDGAIHKYLVATNGDLTEIGIPWFDNGVENEGVTSPHGLSTDLNGYIYIGETSNGDVRRFTCDGEISPTSGNNSFVIDVGGTNYASQGNLFFTNGGDDIAMYDLCSGTLLGSVNFCEDPDSDWGFYLDNRTGQMYATAAIRTNRDSYFWTFDIDDFDNDPSTCISATPLTNYPGRGSDIRGVTTDVNGNVYIVVQDDDPDGPSFLLKYGPAPTFTYLGASAVDGTDDGTGYNLAIGIVYSEIANLLYVSTESTVDDCISVFDTSLVYQGTGVPGQPGSTNAKGIAINKECCPTNNNITIDTTLCAASINDTLFLQELINCNGTICEGIWQEGMSNTGMTYNSCNNSVTIDALAACGSFTLDSDGVGNNPQCGAFKIVVNISIATQPEAKVFAIQPSCTNGNPNNDGYLQLSEITNGNRFNWSLGSTYTGDPDYANATDVSSVTFPYTITAGLSNPSGSQDYTVRIFSGETTCSGHCYTDYTVTMNEQDCTVGCDCEEMIYLNEPTTDGAVHKFSVATDGTLSEIGSPWFDNAIEMEGLTSPHGLGTDLNGYLYIAEQISGDIRKFTCDGEIFPETGTNGFILDDVGGTNFGSLESFLMTNGGSGIDMYDLCTGDFVSKVQFCQTATADWGLYVDKRTGRMYATTSILPGQTKRFWTFDINDFDNDVSTCVDEIRLDSLPRGTDTRVMGVTTDIDENVYIVVREDEVITPGYSSNYVLKYSPYPNFNFLARSPLDTLEEGSGYYKPMGIIYSETADRIYVSTVSKVDDCVAVFDTDLNYLGAAVPSPGTGDNAKGIAINKECCPTNNNITVDTTLCAASLNDVIFLQELINCNGTICEGLWQDDLTNSGLIYDPCNNSITIDSTFACGSFVLESDGTVANAKCDAFKITVNICTDCYDWGDLPDISNTTAALDYQTDSLNNGPSHLLVGGLYLGAGVDEEDNGQSSTDALGDGSDEDGLAFPSSMQIVSGGTLNIPLSVTNTTGDTAYIEMWIDWNGDGDFNDPDEMVTDLDDGSGAFPEYLSIPVPTDGTINQNVGVRIRLSNEDDMTPYGPVGSGEVEDYLIQLVCPDKCLQTESSIIQGSN